MIVPAADWTALPPRLIVFFETMDPNKNLSDSEGAAIKARLETMGEEMLLREIGLSRLAFYKALAGQECRSGTIAVLRLYLNNLARIAAALPHNQTVQENRMPTRHIGKAKLCLPPEPKPTAQQKSEALRLALYVTDILLPLANRMRPINAPGFQARGFRDLLFAVQLKGKAKDLTDDEQMLLACRADIFARDLAMHGLARALLNLDTRLLKASWVGR